MLPATAFALLVDGMAAAFRRPDANRSTPARYPDAHRRGAVRRTAPRSHV